MSSGSVTIHYRRPPGRVQLFEQAVVERSAEYTVTYLPHADVPQPIRERSGVILEPGSPIVWFTYPGAWHDVGRFHRADGAFTGYYANILTPVVMEAERWETTDLFLDVWLPVTGEPALLDEEELEEAVRSGWVDEPTAVLARAHAAGLLAAARDGSWPPQHVREWSLERVAERLGQASESTTAAETRRRRST